MGLVPESVRIPLALQALFGRIAFQKGRGDRCVAESGYLLHCKPCSDGAGQCAAIVSLCDVRIPLALQALFGPLVRMLVDAE